MIFLLRSLARGMVIFSCLAQASCAKGVSMLMPMTAALSREYWPSPALISQSSCVQTPVKAAGKKRRTVFFLPKFSLNLTSTSPVADLDLRVKSGALEPTLMGIEFYLRFVQFTEFATKGYIRCQR